MSEAMSLPMIDHATNGVPFTHAQCTQCQRRVYLNKLGACPSLVGRSATGGGGRSARTPLVQVPQLVLGLRGSLVTCETHGEIRTNRSGECPKCAVLRAKQAWQDHYAQRSGPDMAGAGIEVEAASPVQALVESGVTPTEPGDLAYRSDAEIQANNRALFAAGEAGEQMDNTLLLNLMAPRHEDPQAHTIQALETQTSLIAEGMAEGAALAIDPFVEEDIPGEGPEPQVTKRSRSRKR